MRQFHRLSSPEVLKLHWEQWGCEWEKRLVENPSAAFHWHQVAGEKVNHVILPTLKGQVQDHCSFCDNYPVSPPSNDTVEHFRPKTRFPLEAYQWENLYYCCDFCQGKADDYDDALLRPDAEDYVFEKYFRWDFTRGTLEINPHASAEDQHRAEVTRRLYRLNDGHPSLRRREMRRRAKCPDDPLDDFAYRHYLGNRRSSEHR